MNIVGDSRCPSESSSYHCGTLARGSHDISHCGNSSSNPITDPNPPCMSLISKKYGVESWGEPENQVYVPGDAMSEAHGQPEGIEGVLMRMGYHLRISGDRTQ